MRPRLLDLFCGAGGAAMGYHRAGFDVVGVDANPQPCYPFTFLQADAIGVLEAILTGHFEEPDAIHASPPCQVASRASHFHGKQDDHEDLIPVTRRLLGCIGVPSVIENVDGARLRRDVVLCGEMFGLKVHRHRAFEIDGFAVMQSPHSRHSLLGAATNTEIRDGFARGVYGHLTDLEGASKAMGIDWMETREELAQAIPPAYTEHIGAFLLEHLKLVVAP